MQSQISYPNSTAFQLEQSHYWSQQQALTQPTCRFSPNNAVDVSLAILTVRVTQCQFAVKSGGHAAFEGASNIQGGMTIDLINLNQLTVRSDHAQTSVGAGNVWFDVYTQLQPMGLSVVGGRVSAIGVGGLTLGGGISFFSGRYGWACDNVNTYEVRFFARYSRRLEISQLFARSYLRTVPFKTLATLHTPTCTLRFVVAETTLA
jgi:FAD/FMN-containing dehydrogenase